MYKKVYFFCCPLGAPEKSGYEHQIVSIAEGLKELGISFYSNIKYWKESFDEEKFLLNVDQSISYHDCDVVVFSSNLFLIKGLNYLPKNLFCKDRKYRLIFIDHADGLTTPGFEIYKNVDIILKSHYNLKYPYPSNFVPWQFGLTNRIIDSTSLHNNNSRNNEILVNFRVSHSTRDEAKRTILPIIYNYLKENYETESISETESKAELNYWHQTGRRHYNNYYKRLSNIMACACFGGYLQKSIPLQSNKVGYYLRHLDYKFNLFKYDKVYQFDSWRFWESLAAGCCTFHIDFEKYGAVLPVMPKNGEHYIGVDFDNVAALKANLEEGLDHIQEIGAKGRNWVLQHYSPKSTAERFMEIIDNY